MMYNGHFAISVIDSWGMCSDETICLAPFLIKFNISYTRCEYFSVVSLMWRVC